MAFWVGWGPHTCDWPGFHLTFSQALYLCIYEVYCGEATVQPQLHNIVLYMEGLGLE